MEVKNEDMYDVVIVGAGSMGLAAGAYLAKKQVKVLMIDAFDPPHNHGSHHGDTRMIRHAYGEGRQYVTLVKRAQQLWEQLETETDLPIFSKTGVIGLGPKDSEFLQETITSAEKHDLPLQVLSSKEINERWEGLSVPEDFIGCFESESGIIYSDNAIKAYKEIALKNGAELLTNTPVERINIEDEQLLEINTRNQVIYAKKVIVTVGAWASKLLPDIELPIQPMRKAFGWFEAPEKLYDSQHFPSFYVENNEYTCYGFPSIDGAGLKIGCSEGGQPIDPNIHVQNFGAYDSDENDLRYFLKEYMPQANGKLLQGKTCLYTVSEDNHFIIDQHPEQDCLIFACGFSGHGFKFASVMGEVLSELVLEGKSQYDLSIFSIGRFNKR